MGMSSMGASLAEQIGSETAGQVTGQLLGMAFSGWNNQNQLNQQTNLDAIQLQDNEALSQFNYNQQLQMWNETNYPAQVQQMEAAGLNPALMYGGRGAGGATTGTPTTGISGAAAPSQNAAQTAQLGIMSQEAEADINLKNAQAANLQAKTPQEAPLMTAQTASITQGIENQKAQEALTQMQTTATGIQNTIQGQTIDDQIASIRAAATTIESQAQQAVRNNYIDANTMDAKIKTIQGQMIGTFITNQLQQSQTQMNQTQITNIQNQIQQNWQQIKINKQNANTQEGQLQLQQLIKDIPDSQGIIIQGLTRLIPNIML